MKTCRQCGHVYTPQAMVCPRCHGYGPLTGGPHNHVVAAGPAILLDIAPPAPKPAPSYPDWVKLASFEMTRGGYGVFRLSDILARMKTGGASDGARDVVRAVLCFRLGEPLPALDPGVETVATNWLSKGAQS
jgi:hypothetical protein